MPVKRREDGSGQCLVRMHYFLCHRCVRVALLAIVVTRCDARLGFFFFGGGPCLEYCRQVWTESNGMTLSCSISKHMVQLAAVAIATGGFFHTFT